MNLENFTSGMGSILNLFPTNENRELNFKVVSDEEALMKDWEAISDDFNVALEKCNSEKN